MATIIEMTEKTSMLEGADKPGKADKIEKNDMDKRISVLHKNNSKEKTFGLSRVSWVIKNYCVTPFSEEKTFYSPDFYVRGLYLTMWKMTLTRSAPSSGCYVKCVLKRLPCEPYKGEVKVECCLEYNGHHGEITEVECNGSVNVNESETLILDKAGIDPTDVAHSDIFTIKLLILVYLPNTRYTFPLCLDEGIRRLSEDLILLYNEGISTDFTLCFGICQLPVHKAILVHRLTNETFRRKITSRPHPFIMFEDFTPEQTERVIRFLYTGDLSYAVVVDPAIAVFRLAELLDVKPIVSYYNPDEFLLNSDTEVEEYFTTLIIPNFCDREDCFQSPVMINSMMDTKWYLQVFPKGRRGDEKNVHFSLKYETSKLRDICAKLFLVRKETIFHIYHRRIFPEGKLCGTSFVKREDVINNCTSDDNLIIGLRLRMCMDKENISVVESKSGYKHLSEQRNYNRLSEDILSIHQNDRFADMRLEFSRHNIVINAHNYILHVRCLQLLNPLRMPDLSYFDNIHHAVIIELFYFVYSGRIKNHFISLEGIFCLYRTADNFAFENLMKVIKRYLHESLSETNARLVFQFASGEHIESLETSARYILERNGQRD